MAEQETSSSGGNAIKWLIGCSVGLVALAILCGGGVFILIPILVEKGADMIYEAVVSELEESGLPQGEVDEIAHHLDRLKDGVLAGEVDGEKVEEVLGDLTEGPLLPMGIAFGFSSYALANAELDPEEQRTSRLDVRRLQKGLWEGDIDAHDALRIFDRGHVGGQHQEGDWEDVEEIRAIAGEIRALADEAGITDTDFEFDVSDEIGRRVDAMLGD